MNEQHGDERTGPVLVAIDLIDISYHVLAWAADYARSQGSHLHILHVAHDPGESPGRYVATTGVDNIEHVATTRLDDWLASDSVVELLPGIETSAEVVTGIPATRTIEVANAIGAWHIVIGAHGKSGWIDRVLGSTADRIVHRARTCVTVVKKPDRDEA